MAQVQVGLGPVVRDVDLAVLEGIHGPGVHVDVGIELLDRHLKAAGLQEGPDGRGGEPLAQRGQHAARDENKLGLHDKGLLAAVGVLQGIAPRPLTLGRGARIVQGLV